MSQEKTNPETSVVTEDQRPRRSRRKTVALVVAGVLLIGASSFAGSMAGAGMAAEKGPDGPPASTQSETPDGPPAGFGPS